MILTNENYFSKEADMEYMSVSQFKAFEQCEAAALASVKGEWERPKTTALLRTAFALVFHRLPLLCIDRIQPLIL